MTGGLDVAVEHDAGAFRLRAAFTAPAGVTALFGRSGSGKTTLVGAIAGLVRPRRARIVAGGVTLVDTDRGVSVPTHRRRLGTVFQDARLLPHLGVRANLLFGRAFAPRGEPGPSLAEVVDLLGIGHLLGRGPAALSGGERQRVAIGRALLAKPRLLLMDEPLAALDEARKAEILPFLERVRDETRVPIVYVSHSLPEVARLADTLVVLENGRVEAAGEASPILARLDLPTLSGTREEGAVLAARIVAHDPGFALTRLATPAGDLLVPRLDRSVGARLRVRIAARNVMLSLAAPAGLSALNILAGRVDAVGEPGEGSAVPVRLLCGDGVLVARVTRLSAASLDLRPGLPVWAVVKSVALDPAAG